MNSLWTLRLDESPLHSDSYENVPVKCVAFINVEASSYGKSIHVYILSYPNVKTP